MTFLAAAWAAMFGVANRLRGMKGMLVVVPALLVWALTWRGMGNPPVLEPWTLAVTIGAMACFIFGESWGWSKWIWGLMGIWTQAEWNNNSQWVHDDTGKKNGLYWLANSLVEERANYHGHAVAGLALRGAFWFVFLLAWWAYFGITSIAGAVIGTLVLGATMPLTYTLGYKLSKWNRFGYLQNAEVLYGLVMGAVLFLVTSV